MGSLAKSVVSAFVVGIAALACNNTPEPMQAIVASNIQPQPTGTCNASGKFLYLPEAADIPGPDTSKDTNIVVTGTGDDVITCSVVANGSAYDVTLQSQITGGTAPGTLTIKGSFTTRTRDANGNPTAAGDAVAIPNIQVDFLAPTGHLQEKDCTAQYVLANNGGPGSSLPSAADVFADDHGGRIWASVFCPKLTNLSTDKTGLDGCAGSATFRFENCSNK